MHRVVKDVVAGLPWLGTDGDMGHCRMRAEHRCSALGCPGLIFARRAPSTMKMCNVCCLQNLAPGCETACGVPLGWVAWTALIASSS